MVNKCIDTYTKKRCEMFDKKLENIVVDARMESIVNRKFEQCFEDGTFKWAIGIALETKRIDVIKEAILRSGNPGQMLSYTYTLATGTVHSKDFRTEILAMLLEVYEDGGDDKLKNGDHDYYKIAKCQFALNQPVATAELLKKLACGSEEQHEDLIAFQIAFDVVEKEN